MNVMYVCNAFSLSMLDREATQTRARIPIPVADTTEAVRRLREWRKAGREVVSAVGHRDTAVILSALLLGEIPSTPDRITVKLGMGDVALIAQLTGPRPPEGSTTLPQGAAFEWWII